MQEKDFRAKLIKEFNPLRVSTAFIWSFDSHFKAGFPDLYWLIRGRPFHAELKICKDKHLPKDIWSLPTKIQKVTMKQLKTAGAEVYLFILHAPPHGPKTVTISSFSSSFFQPASSQVFSASSFWAWWSSLVS